jgi:hypothetical protein
MWRRIFSRMDRGDEFGNGYTKSINPGMTSGCIDLTYAMDKVWEYWPQIECPFSTNWSTDIWFENVFHTNLSANFVNAESRFPLQVFREQSNLDIICLSSFYALTSWYLLSRLAQSAWKQPEKQRSTIPSAYVKAEWNGLPADVQARVIAGLPYESLYQLKAVSKPLKECIDGDSFLSFPNEFNFENVTLSTPYFFIADGVWQCAGFDSSLQKWRRLPPFTFLPADCEPDLDLFKEYLVCTKDGIVCMNVSKSTEDRLIVFNPLRKTWRELPPLNHRRNPVLMHLVVDASTQSYQVIVAGSSRSGDERLSKMTEVFDSRTWEWKRTGDLPGPDYALNDYQSGVYKDGYLYCIAFLDQEVGRGILRYNLSKGVWLKNWTYPIAFAATSNILQLVENCGELYLFSEQEIEHRVEHCIDRVEWDMDGNGGVLLRLSSVVRSKKFGGRSLEIYPEYTCVPYSEHQLCVFNTIDHSGVVYDVRNQGHSELLQAPPARGFNGESFFSLNPMSFTIQPSFRSKI